MRSEVLSPSELEGTDYLLSSTMRLEDSFLQIFGKQHCLNEYVQYISEENLFIENQLCHVVK